MLRRFLHDQTGAIFAEYALMLAILCGGIACLAFYLGDTISAALHHTGNLISAEWDGISSGRPLP